MTTIMKLPKGMAAFSCDGADLEVTKTKGAGYVEVPAEHVQAALQHGLEVVGETAAE